MVAVNKAAANPAGGAPSHSRARSRLVKDFPFSVVYRADASEVLIAAIIHHRRKPAYWADRL
jgi:plasmid stabilization system protein ParE